MGSRAPLHGREVPAAQFCVGRCADSRVLRRDRAATKQITPATRLRIIGDALPEQAEDVEITMLAVDACAAKLDDFRAQRLEDMELKFLRAVVAEVFLRAQSCLQ